MNAMNEKISAIGVVPVIKLNHPERDAAKLGKALSAGGVPVAEMNVSFSSARFIAMVERVDVLPEGRMVFRFVCGREITV